MVLLPEPLGPYPRQSHISHKISVNTYNKRRDLSSGHTESKVLQHGHVGTRRVAKVDALDVNHSLGVVGLVARFVKGIDFGFSVDQSKQLARSRSRATECDGVRGDSRNGRGSDDDGEENPGLSVSH